MSLLMFLGQIKVTSEDKPCSEERWYIRNRLQVIISSV